MRGLDTDPVVDLALGMQHLDFAQLCASGLAVPESLEMASGAGRDLGSATIDVRVRGRPADPASLSVSQKITSGRHQCRGDRAPARRFIFRSEDGPGRTAPSTSRSHPRLHRLRDVPPLFVRTLLLRRHSFTPSRIDKTA